jgi:rare lipoprotein A
MRVVRIGLALLLLGCSAANAESGKASYYPGIGKGSEMTCAHRTRPFGSIVKVSYRSRTIHCRVNDRGPFIRGRIIDVSTSAARALGMMSAGVVVVLIE